MHGSNIWALRAAACALAFTATSGAASPLTECGKASWYDHAGRPTASGGTVDPNTLTAAHRTLPFGTKVRVENLDNGKSVIVEIDDRGPFVPERIIDLSLVAAEHLAFKSDGVTRVRISKIQSKPKATSGNDACR